MVSIVISGQKETCKISLMKLSLEKRIQMKERETEKGKKKRRIQKGNMTQKKKLNGGGKETDRNKKLSVTASMFLLLVFG